MDGLLNKYDAFCCQPNFLLLLEEEMFRMQVYKIADRLRMAADSFHMMHFVDVFFINETSKNMYVFSLCYFFFSFEAAESDRRVQCQPSHSATFVD